MNSRTLKKHLKYIVPEMRLALIKEPGAKPVPIGCPDDLDRFVEPLKHYSEALCSFSHGRKESGNRLSHRLPRHG